MLHRLCHRFSFELNLWFRLDASIIKIEYKNDSIRENTLDFSENALSEKSVTTSNGNANITKDYAASKKFKEVLEFTNFKGFSNVHTVGVEYAAEKDVEIYIYDCFAYNIILFDLSFDVFLRIELPIGLQYNKI